MAKVGRNWEEMCGNTARKKFNNIAIGVDLDGGGRAVALAASVSGFGSCLEVFLAAEFD